MATAKRTTVKSKGADRKDRLAALRKKLEETDYGSSGSAGFWSPNEGKNTIRILPEVGEMEFFYQAVGKHWMPDKNKAYCPTFTSEGVLDCPICDLQKELWNAGDKASKALANEVRVKKSFWMNVMVRGRDGTSTGPFIYTPGKLAFDALTAFINDPDYGDIFDEYDGLDITITKSGSGKDTKYDLVPKRKSSPLMESEEEIERVLNEAKDLTFVEVSMDPDEDEELSAGHAVYVLPYDRLVEELGLEDGIPTAPVEEEDEDDEDEDEAVSDPVKDIQNRRARRSRK